MFIAMYCIVKKILFPLCSYTKFLLITKISGRYKNAKKLQKIMVFNRGTSLQNENTKNTYL